MLLTWYLVSTSYILSSPVLSYCPDHAVAFVPYLHTFPMEISFTNYILSTYFYQLSASVYFLGFLFKTFKLLFILILDFLTHIFKSQKKNFLLKNKTTNLTRGRWWSPFLLTFPRAILRSLFIISALLLLVLSFQALSPLYCSPNPLQLDYVPLFVVATTCHSRTNDLTTSKALQWAIK